MIYVYSIKLDRALTKEEREVILNIITPERKAKALRFRRLLDQDHSMVTGLLERYCLTRQIRLLGETSEAGMPENTIRKTAEQIVSKVSYTIVKGEEGKPYVEGYPDIHYNLSHSGDYVVCAISNHPVGIDIEQEDRFQENVVRRFFQSEEMQDILSQDNEEKQKQVFAQYWVMKESFMKLSGAGFAIPLKTFSCNRTDGSITVFDTAPEKWKAKLRNMGRPLCRFFQMEEGYAGAICTADRMEEPDELNKLDEPGKQIKLDETANPIQKTELTINDCIQYFCK